MKADMDSLPPGWGLRIRAETPEEKATLEFLFNNLTERGCSLEMEHEEPDKGLGFKGIALVLRLAKERDRKMLRDLLERAAKYELVP